MKFFNFENSTKSRRHQSIIKESNIKQIFDLIFENEKISRIEISRAANLSRSTVSILIDELLEAGLIEMTGERESDSSGRKPIGLEINGRCAQILTLALKPGSFNYCLYDISGKPVDSFSGKAVYRKGCAAKIWNLIRSRSPLLDPAKLLAVCASIPAKINKAEKNINLSILDTAEKFDLLAELKGMCPELPLVAVNQSSACAYAEYKYVYSGKPGDLIYFNFNDGVGAGIMVNGRLFTGEIGHMSINSNGPLCGCGKRGCLENAVNKAAILKEFTSAAGKNPDGFLYKVYTRGSISYSHIREALEQNDAGICKAAGGIAEKIALGISNVICMFDPEKIIIGGSVVELGKVFLNMVLQKIEIPGTGGVRFEDNSRIVPAGLGADAELLGVLRFFLDKIFTISTETENSIHLGD
jgi:predicted NBD/HSP70 family sugar kinase/predicted transcriptional regulator